MQGNRPAIVSLDFCKKPATVIKCTSMTEESYEKLDDLFKEVRLSILKVRENDPENGNKLKGLIGQLELWMDSLVVDSLKLKTLQSEARRRGEFVKGLIERLESKSNSTPDRLTPASPE